MSAERKIMIAVNGPYIVSGKVPLTIGVIGTNARGESIKWKEGRSFPVSEQYALCRCGRSKTTPFCDGTHLRFDFNGTETANRRPVMEQAEVFDGSRMQLFDAEELCAFARFCDPNGRVWNQVADTEDPQVRRHFVHQVGMCPAGRLMAVDKDTGEQVEPDLPPSICAVEDPSWQCSGPLWIRGGIVLVGCDGKRYEIRNRMTLCRCGRSENKPFCDAAHASEPKFHDGIE